MNCVFDKPWQGACGELTDFSSDKYCTEHLAVKCYHCREQATHGCSYVSSLCCGMPLCDKKVCKELHGRYNQGH